MIYLHSMVLLLLSVLIAWAIAKACAARWQGSIKKLFGCTSIIITACAAISWLLNGLGLHVLKTIILSALFCYISYSDIKTHEVDDHLHIMVLLTAMIGIAGDQLPSRLAASLVAIAITLLIARIPGTVMGGADVKFSAVCAFLMPPIFFCLGICLGWYLALILNSPFMRKGNAKVWPFMPYLSLGVMLAFLLQK